MANSISAGSSPSFFNILNYGAVGDGRTLNTPAIQAAVDACSQAGGGTVYLPAGGYVTGSIGLKSNLTLHLEAGATLLGSQNQADYPIIEGRWEGVDQKTHASLLTGDRLNRVTLTGRGVIDGQGAYWWQKHRAKTLEYPRPRLIGLTECTNVLIEGLTLTNSPSWTVNPVRCQNVTLTNLTVLNPADSPNTDGLNPDSCRDVHISNCHIDVGDDCITLKSGTEAAEPAKRWPCENITITNCTMVHGHGGVVIGSEMSGGVRNVVISNCIFTGTDRGIRLKTRRGRGGVIEDIQAANIIMNGVLCPLVINLYYEVGANGDPDLLTPNPRPVTEATPRVRGIRLSHITARQVEYAAGFIYGLPEMPVEDISLSHVTLSMADQGGAGSPAMAPGIEPMRRAGFVARHVRGLRLDHVEIARQEGPAFQLSHVSGVDIHACAAPTPPPAEPVISLDQAAQVSIHNCLF